MEKEPICPKCGSANTYSDGNLWVCPECSNEWSLHESQKSEVAGPVDEGVVKDAHGNELKTGDAVTLIKDLKIKGASSTIKVGTKVKNIRLIEAEDGHNISCKIDGIGSINLKSEFVKKV